MNQNSRSTCSDCESVTTRRSFLHAVGGTALTAGLASTTIPWLERTAHAAPTAQSGAETVAAELYKSLSDEQRKVVCFDFDHELRKRISANWHITKPTIDDSFYTKQQRATAEEIVRKVMSAEGYERLVKQTAYDDGGLGSYSMAMFGTPDSGKFQWMLTGRHLTLRADGDSVDKAAFGGPMIYGHGEEDPNENLYSYQTKQTNEVFKALDAAQAKQALIAKAPGESAVQIQGASGTFPGIGVGALSSDQQQLVADSLKVLLAPYRAEDAEEVMALLEADGGVGKLHMAFYENEDLNSDKVWDIWRVEGPSFVWHFRGAPHVHAYINIAAKS